MSLLKRTKLLLRSHRILPKKSLGQNFTVDPSVFQLIADYAMLSQKDVILDIGAGLGFLTRFLADKCGSVLAVEADGRLVKVLQEQLHGVPNVRLIEGNVLEAEVPQFNKVAAFPPYSISSPLILWLFKRDFDCAVAIFQKEFAKRLVASVGAQDYGWLAVVAYYYVEAELLDDVSKWMFYPQPEVDSIIVRLKPRKPPPFKLRDEALFQRMVQSIFPRRNRKVRNALLSFAEVSRDVVEAVPFRDRRVRELAPEDFGALANALAG
jgi:16S rRNA (adenine1518-N6/adenine1519-N6)-dimethyltransferase